MSDFGLARSLNTKSLNVIQNQTRKLPLRWMSPEAIEKSTFSVQSDVVYAGFSQQFLWKRHNPVYLCLNNPGRISYFVASVVIWNSPVGTVHFWWDPISWDGQHWNQAKVGYRMEITSADRLSTWHVNVTCSIYIFRICQAFVEMKAFAWTWGFPQIWYDDEMLEGRPNHKTRVFLLCHFLGQTSVYVSFSMFAHSVDVWNLCATYWS